MFQKLIFNEDFKNGFMFGLFAAVVLLTIVYVM